MIKKFSKDLKRKEARLKNGAKLGGVEFSTLAAGEKSMLTIMYYKKGSVVPEHSHPQEQLGFVVSGKLKVKIGDQTGTIEKYDSYAVHGNAIHSLKALEDSVVIDTFAPIREEYLDK